MKLHSKTLELRAVKTMCGDDKTSLKMISKLNDKMFHNEAPAAAYSRVLAHLKSSGESPSWDLLCEDPVLNQSIRKELKTFNKKPFKSTNITQAVGRLKEYSSARTLLTISENILVNLKEDSVDVDKLTTNSADALASIRLGTTDAKMWDFGKGNNTRKLAKRVLSGTKDDSIPTCFDVWDRVNTGLPKTGVMLMAGNTGGGKSILAGEMSARMSERGYEVALASLEMGEVEITARMMARVARIPINKMMKGVGVENGLTKKEGKRALRKYDEWIKKCDKAGGRVRLFDPDETPTMLELLYALKSYSPDIIIIDYVALLAEVDGDDDWRKLSEAVRVAKRFAKKNRIPVVILAQLSDEGKLLYAKRMLHDADLAWFWIADDEVKETGYVRVKQPKARNLDPFPFWLKFDWPYTSVREAQPDEITGGSDDDDEEEVDTKGKKSKKKKKTVKLKDLASPNFSDI